MHSSVVSTHCQVSCKIHDVFFSGPDGPSCHMHFLQRVVLCYFLFERGGHSVYIGIYGLKRRTLLLPSRYSAIDGLFKKSFYFASALKTTKFSAEYMCKERVTPARLVRCLMKLIEYFRDAQIKID